MKKIFVKIDGIHCEHCISKITKQLLNNNKIKNVEIKRNIAHISYTGKLSKKDLIDTIKEIDYFTKEEYISDRLNDVDSSIKLKEFIIILVCILGFVFLINYIFGFNIFNMIPTIDSSLTYGMLVVTGLLTSIHCISMCGAINLMAVVDISNKRNFKRPILYNIGRVLSYTLIGGIAGFIGNILSINYFVMGVIIIIAAIIMLLMSLSMLGIVEFRFPNFIKYRPKKFGRNSFVIGFLNGFMPCGPLQAMQLYALSTGNLVTGSLSMFLFGIGTVPLMLIVGVVFNFVKGKRKILLNKIASVLILLLSIVMINRGLITLDIDIFKAFNNYGEFTKTTLKEDYQVIEFDLSYDSYEDIIVQKDVPVKMIINVDKNSLTGCNNELVINKFDIKQKLSIGKNVIEFTPNETGEYTYSCWMNMIKNNIKVIDDKDYFKED